MISRTAPTGTLDDALARAQELDMRHLVAHCHLGLGKLCTQAGKREQAREHLTMATTMLREMGMRFWLEKSKRRCRDALSTRLQRRVAWSLSSVSSSA